MRQVTKQVKTIIRVAFFLILLISSTLCFGNTYYEIWRQGLAEAEPTMIATSIKTTSYEDTQATDGIYFYYIKCVTTQTETREWINLQYQMRHWFTCPTKAKPNTTIPVHVEVEVGGGIYGSFQATLNNQILENNAQILDAWSVGPLFISLTFPQRRSWTRYITPSLTPAGSNAEIKLQSRLGSGSWHPTNCYVQIRNELDPAPANFQASRGTYSNRIRLTWSSSTGTSDLSTPMLGWREGYQLSSGIHISHIPDHQFDTNVSVTLIAAGNEGLIKSDYNGRVRLYANGGPELNLTDINFSNGIWNGTFRFDSPAHTVSVSATSGQLSGLSNEFCISSSSAVNGFISGTCVDTHDNLITLSNLKVELYRGEEKIREIITFSGLFTFTEIPAGQYLLVATSDNYKSGTPKTVTVRPRQGTRENITLHKEGKPVLFVPGLLGSTTGGGKAYSLHPMIKGDIWTKHDNLKLTRPFAVVGWSYLRDALKIWDYEIYHAPWDWRRNICDGLVQDYLIPIIDQAKINSNSDKVDIVAHSAGGLLVRYYIQSDLYRNDIDKFAMVGTPNGGASQLYYLWEGWGKYGDEIKEEIEGYHKVIANLYSDYKNRTVKNLYEQPPGEVYYFIQQNIPGARDYMLISSPFISKPDGSLEYYYAKEGLITYYLANYNNNKSRLVPGSEENSSFEQVRTRLFVKSEPESTLSRISVNNSSGTPATYDGITVPMFVQGFPIDATPLKSTGDGTVLTVSALYELDPIENYDSVVLTSGFDHASLIYQFINQIREFLEEGRVNASYLYSEGTLHNDMKTSNVQDEGASEITLLISGRVQPLLKAPNGLKQGVCIHFSDPNDPIIGDCEHGEYFDEFEADVLINQRYSSFTIQNPEDGVYLLEFKGDLGDTLQIGASYTQKDIGLSDEFSLIMGEDIYRLSVVVDSSSEVPLQILKPVKMIKKLRAAPEGVHTRLSWDAPQNESVAGYRIYGRGDGHRLFQYIGEIQSTTGLINLPWYERGENELLTFVVQSVAQNGQESFFSETVQNYEPLRAKFEVDQVIGTVPTTIQFTDHSTGNPTSWEWDFNADGIIDSTEQNPIWTYSEPGSYAVILTVHNDDTSDIELVIPCVQVWYGLENLYDFLSLWLQQDCIEPTWCQGFDSNQSGTVDFEDFAKFSQLWFDGIVVVPNLVGMNMEDAEVALLSIGLSVGTVSEVFDDTVDEGHVVSHTPHGGLNSLARASVDIVISKGPASTVISEGFESGDFSSYTWQHSGNAPWVIVSDTKYEGTYSAKSGIITHDQESTLGLTIDGDYSTVSFYAKVSSEENYDGLVFYINGIPQYGWSGEMDWELKTFSLGTGQNFLEWVYLKDISDSSGSDCAWIDNIRIE